MKINDKTNERIDEDATKLLPGTLTTQESTARKDVIVLSILSIVVFAIASKFEAFEKIVSWAALHENWEVDEFLTLWIIIPLSLAIFAVRRWREYRRELIRRLQAEEELRLKTHQLNERVKELNCLYAISNLVETSDQSVEDLFQGVIDLIPPSWQYPQITCARSILHDREFKTETYRIPTSRQSADILAHGERVGLLEVAYFEDAPQSDEGPFLKEERNLIDTIAARLGRIVERKHAEQALLESRENFLTFFETMDDIIVVGDTDGKILHTNSAASRKLGYTPDELKTMHVLDLNPKDQRQEAETILSQMFKAERNSCPLPLEKKDRTIIPSETRVWFGKWSSVDCIFGICKDLSREQEALQKFNKFFELNPTPMAVNSLPDRKLMEVNESWLSTLGFSRDEIIGKTSAELGLFVDPETQQEFAKRLQEQGSARNIELRISKKDGTILEGLFSGETIDSQGRNYFVTAMLDITDRKRLEQERLEMERKLLRAQKLESLSVMAGGIAHDFNNQLAVVLGNLQLALEDLPPAESEVKSSIVYAIESAKRSAELSQQMQTFTGCTLYFPKDLDLNEFLNKNLDVLKSSVPKHVSFNFDRCNALPPIKGDPGQIQRLVRNILFNAAEAVGDMEGCVLLSTGVVDCDETYLSHSRLEEKPAPGRFVLLEVSDNGCGMDAQTLHRLFDPFFTTKFTGRGLGMAEVIGVVKGHNGAIVVESEFGNGTTIRVLFPLPRETRASTVQVMEPVATNPSAPITAIQRKTVLIVEDEIGVANVVVRRLDVLGYNGIIAVDGEEGISLFRDRSNEIDLVMLDFAMPNMNGVEAFGELIRIKSDIKVILSSGYAEDVVMQSFPGQRPASVLHKPYKMEDLKAELERLLGSALSGVSKDVNS